jgi:hypothetical protein
MAEEISPLEDHGWWMERLRKDAKANRPEALRLAAQLEDAESARLHLLPYAAAELRRLHGENKLLHERHHFDNGVLKELLEAYRKMRNSAAGYSNFCDDNANTRRCERDFVAAEALYRAAIQAALKEKNNG